MTLNRILICVLSCALLHSALMADVVHMRDGRRFDGKARRQGDKVVVETAMGRVVLDAADVLAIEEGQPASKPSASGPAAPAAVKAPQSRITLPECMVFLKMQQLAGLPHGAESYEVRKQIDIWRSFAHDHKRLVGNEWAQPEVFTRTRTSYVELINEAQALLNQKTDKDADAAKNALAANRSLAKAASIWPDALMRSFLTGVALHLAGRGPQAQERFAACIAEAPLVPGFRQGRAMALLADDKPFEAMEEAMAALKLSPDSPELVELLGESMKKAPGRDIKRPQFVEATAMLAGYDTARLRTRSGQTVWQMGRKGWPCKDGMLPVPEYDRIIIRQALGVAVSDHSLLVDSQAVEDAQFVFVKVDSAWYPATVRKVSASASHAALSIIHAPDLEFTPAVADVKSPQPVGPASAWGVACYAELGAGVRPLATIIEEDGGSFRSSSRLSAGEALSPVVSDGRLLGFIAGKTDPFTEGGGEDKFIPLSAVERLIRQASSKSGVRRSPLRRDHAPRRVDGVTFIIQSIVGEASQR
ncbi:MAG: hypothetical protein GXY38_09945 [Planctomycetes bacterium]|nr:hypothetical protein [Planctomycetota bacterium]